MTTKKVGILALQGAFQAHAKVFQSLGAKVIEIRNASGLEAIDALTLPGGESSTLLKLCDKEFREKIREKILRGTPALATCAGIILLANKVFNPEQDSLKVLDIEVTRNAYGSQVDSFINPSLKLSKTGADFLNCEDVEGVFIRAPKICRTGGQVEILALDKNDPVLIRQENIIAATFHPELAVNLFPIHQKLLQL